MFRTRVPLGLLLLVFCATAGIAADGDFSIYQKRFREAFKPLRVASAKQLEKRLESELPQGIVTEAGPFHALVDKLLSDHAGPLDERDALLGEFAPHASPKAGDLLVTAFKTLERERAELAKRIGGVEADYAEVYDRGYMEIGEKDRRARKGAAVLIPYYRRLIARGAEVSELAAIALEEMAEGEALDWLVTQATGRGEPGLRGAVAEALGRVGGTEARDALARVLTKDGDAEVRMRALGALALLPVSLSKDAVVSALEDPAWQVRSLAGEFCARAKLLSAVGKLIDSMEKEDGRLREDLDFYLGVLVGVRMQGDVELWRRWWEENRERVEKEARDLEASGAYGESLGRREFWEPLEGPGSSEEDPAGASAFYGIITTSKRVAYVIDISRSMDSPAGATPTITGSGGNPYAAATGKSKLDVAKWQLHRAVHDLPKDALMNIVVYSESYKVWREGLVPAGGREKKDAHRFIDALKANGTTNICDSLDRAIELGPDTIYLLSDGDPNRGRVTNLSDLLEDVTRRNLVSRVVIHTIGIGEAAGSSFLESLADATGGRYVGFK